MGYNILQIGELREDSTITYTYNCGHDLTVDVMDVLMLGEEPNWGCREGDCEDGHSVSEICINGSSDEQTKN